MDHNRPELAKGPANFVPLSPLSFLKRAAHVFADRTAVVHGEVRYTYTEFAQRVSQLASALDKAGIKRGDTVAILSANCPAMLEAHYAVPMLGAVLNPVNVRLDGGAIKFCLEHGEAVMMLADREFGEAIRAGLGAMDTPPRVIDITDPETADASPIGSETYEAFIADGDPTFIGPGPEDEWDSICLLYTSGTTGNPKGAVYSHRGAYLAALGNAMAFALDHESQYLWTLPMFHCSGWTFTWAVTAAGGTHHCLRRVDPALIFDAVATHKITHMCGAPIVLNMLIHAPSEVKRSFPQRPKVATGGASPPSAVIAAMEGMGFEVLHLYGTTESYGPATLCAPMAEWNDLDDDARFSKMARQGIGYPVLEEMMVADSETGQPVPRDGETMGEIFIRGNSIMKGYLKNEDETTRSFEGGWYRSGDLAVWHPDGYAEVKDRSKDIIISGGENISSLEVEETLFKHPRIMEAAVVARPDQKWGEAPVAFVTPVPGEEATLTPDDVIGFCRDNMARFKVPKTIVFGPLPKTSTGKIQKFVLRDRAKALGDES